MQVLINKVIELLDFAPRTMIRTIKVGSLMHSPTKVACSEDNVADTTTNSSVRQKGFSIRRLNQRQTIWSSWSATRSLAHIIPCLSILSGGQAFAQNSIQTTRTNTAAVEVYTVPAGYVEADFSVRGADGGPEGAGSSHTQARGGSGATATATYTVPPGGVIRSIVGATGGLSMGGGAGGGGGSAVCLNGSLLVAAGGGGGADNTDNSGGGADNGGSGGINGFDGLSRVTGARAGGTPTTTAEAGEPNLTDVAAGAGGGGIAGGGQNYTSSLLASGTAFGGAAAVPDCSAISAGGAGVPNSTIGPGTDGGSGFGGGGGSWGRAAGGGGGYSGGGGAGNSRWAGGGGSFVDAAALTSNTVNGAARTNLGRDGEIVITVFAQPTATADTATTLNGAAGVTGILNIFSGDAIGGVAASISNMTLALASGSSVPSELTFNAATGQVDVQPGTAPGTYSFSYEICNSDRTNLCTTSTVTITVKTSTPELQS